jgi:hypothetical protein
MPEYSNPSFEELTNMPAGQVVYEKRDGGFIMSAGDRHLIVEKRSADRARGRLQARNMGELYDCAAELCRRQSRTPTGFRARFALLEELSRQATDGF